VSRMAQRFEQL